MRDRERGGTAIHMTVASAAVAPFTVARSEASRSCHLVLLRVVRAREKFQLFVMVLDVFK